MDHTVALGDFGSEAAEVSWGWMPFYGSWFPEAKS